MTDRLDRRDRVRNFLDRNFALAVVCLLVVAAVGGWLAYTTHVDPPVETEEHTKLAATTTGSYEYGSTVEADNPVFPTGTELTDREYFFTSISPILEGEYAYRYSATDDAPVVVETDLVLVLRSVGSEGTEFWRTTEDLGRDRVEEADGEAAVSIPFSVNVTEIERRVAEIEAELGESPGTTEIAIVAETTIESDTGGDTIRETETHRLSIDPREAVYRVAQTDAAERSIERTERVEVVHEGSLLRSLGSILLFVGALGGIVVLVGGRWRGILAPSDEIQTEIEFERERAALDEWITTGTQSVDRFDQPVIAVDSLSGLVDVAIDSDRRVIEDVDRDEYYVVQTDSLYTYSPPVSIAGVSFVEWNDDPLSPDSGGPTGPVGSGDLDRASDDETGGFESDDAETDGFESAFGDDPEGADDPDGIHATAGDDADTVQDSLEDDPNGPEAFEPAFDDEPGDSEKRDEDDEERNRNDEEHDDTETDAIVADDDRVPAESDSSRNDSDSTDRPPWELDDGASPDAHLAAGQEGPTEGEDGLDEFDFVIERPDEDE